MSQKFQNITDVQQLIHPARQASPSRPEAVTGKAYWQDLYT
jgi:hypothetical protein